MWPDADIAKGIDVSHHRGVVDWDLVKQSGVSFGIVKATDGTSFIDPRFDSNWTGMRFAGLIRGAYHFFRPGDDPETQARHYLSQVGDILHESDLPPVLDVEAYPQAVREDFNDLTLSQRLERIQAWLTFVSRETDRLPIIYTNLNTWQVTLQDTEAFTHYPLWIANYEVSQPNLPADLWGGAGFTLWQFSAEGVVPGVNQGEPPVDLNIFNGSVQSLLDWLGIVGARNLPPAVTNAEMISAIFLAAEGLGGDGPDMLARADLSYLAASAAHIARPYDGPGVEDLALTVEEKQALYAALEDIDSGGIYIPGLTNQDMINAFYRAASTLGIAGWTLVELAGLTDLIHAREALYLGPAVEAMDGLNSEQKAALAAALGQITDPDDTDDGDGETPSIPYPGLTNQGMINAFYRAANQLGLPAWPLITEAELVHLAEDRAAIYSGPTVEAMPGIDEAARGALAEALGVEVDPPSGEEVYPGLVNQDIINLFYGAAVKVGEHGWDWVKLAGLAWLAQQRYQVYQGPTIEALPNISEVQRQALLAEMDALRN